MAKYTLEVTVFITGAAVMILELTAARILAPSVGTSLYTWSSIIGVMLGSLSMGYWLGGNLADKKPTTTQLALLIFISCLWIGSLSFTKDILLTLLSLLFTDIRVLAIIAATLLFAAPTVLLGIVSPYATKLKIKNVENSGKTVGHLSALSTLGSIVGTFLTGFYLITYFGNTHILLVLCGVLFLTALLLSHRYIRAKLFFLGIIVLIFFLFHPPSSTVLYSKETPYNSVQIIKETDILTKKPIKVLKIGTEYHSASFFDSDELVFRYTKYYDLVSHFVPQVSHALMIGGGAYSYPNHFLKTYKNANLDVVEIDPDLTAIAKEHFSLRDNPRLRIFHEDGRTYIARTKKQYDAIFIDAFSSYYAIPYHLTTQEAVNDIARLLTPDGVVIVNIISALEGKNAKFFLAEYATYTSVFPNVSVFPVHTTNPHEIQNIILVAMKEKTFNATNKRDDIQEMVKKEWKKPIGVMPVLTNDYAPVDQYIAEFYQ